MDDSAKLGDSPYPATYQAPLWDRIRPALIGTPLIALVLFSRVHQVVRSPWWFGGITACALIFAAVAFLSAGYARITLYRDRIVKTSLFGSMSMRRDEAGKIVPRQRGLKMLSYKYNSTAGMILPKNVGGDEAWNAWMDYSKRL